MQSALCSFAALQLCSFAALQLCSFAAYAALSDSTSIIEGRAPSAVGELVLMSPDAEVITHNILVPPGFVPNDFSAGTEQLALSDLDGDTGLFAEVDAVLAQYIFKRGAVPLTPEQLAQPLGVTAPGGVVTAKITAPVIVSSLTGSPREGTTDALSSAEYALRVASALTVKVNGVILPSAASFPNNGFTGAEFVFLMNEINEGANASYTYVGDKSWFSIDANGRVLFTARPAPGDNVGTITITDKTNVKPEIVYRFKPRFWISNTPLAMTGAFKGAARNSCTALGAGARMSYLRELTNAKVVNAIGVSATSYPAVRNPNGYSLIETWGEVNVSNFPNGGGDLGATLPGASFGWVDLSAPEDMYKFSSGEWVGMTPWPQVQTSDTVNVIVQMSNGGAAYYDSNTYKRVFFCTTPL